VSRLRRIDRVLAPGTWLVAAALALMLLVGPELVAEDKSSGKSEAGATGYAGGAGGVPRIDGKAIFSENCGSCHTLSAAKTSGVVGPRLDGANLSRDAVTEIVRNGRGGMPAFADRLDQAEIRAVAELVAQASR
jgi:mono/diheme cytochrome c family protein